MFAGVSVPLVTIGTGVPSTRSESLTLPEALIVSPGVLSLPKGAQAEAGQDGGPASKPLMIGWPPPPKVTESIAVTAASQQSSG